MSNHPTTPGWYPDAQGVIRWFDGANWTEHTQPGQQPAQQPAYGQPAYGQPQQPAYGTPGGPGGPGGPNYPGSAPSGGSKKGLWIGLSVAGVLLVAGLIVLLIVLLGGDDKDSDRGDDGKSGDADPSTSTTSTTEPVDDFGDPAESVDNFLEASSNGDCDTAVELVTEEFLGDNGDCDPEEAEEFDEASWDVAEAEIDGESATVDVILTFSGTPAEFVFELVVEDDIWKIDNIDIDAPSASSTPEPPTASSATPSP